MRKLMSKKGFTLVELMIVIVIMGILVAVAIPVYGAVTKNAETKTCKSNMSNIKSMAATYQMTGGDDGGLVKIPDAGLNLAADASFAKLFEGGKLPQCPVAKDDPDLAGDAKNYTAVMSKDAATGAISTAVTCPEASKSGYEKHVAD